MNKVPRLTILYILLLQIGLVSAEQLEFKVISISEKEIRIEAGKTDGVKDGLTGIIYFKETIGGNEEYLPIGTFKISQVNSSSCIAEITKIIPSSTKDVLKLYVRFDKKLIKNPTMKQEVKQVSETPVTHDIEIKTPKVSSDDVPEGKDLSFYYSKANELFSEKKYSQAKKYYDKLQKMIPGDKNIEEKLKELIELIKTETEEKNQEIALEEERLKLPYYKMVMEESFKKGDIEKTREYLAKVLALEPKDERADEINKIISTQTWFKGYQNSRKTSTYSIKKTSDKGYIVAGAIDISTTTERNNQCLLLKLDEYGESKWLKLFGGEESEECLDVIQTQDGGYALTGINRTSDEGESDLYIIKTDVNGNSKWEKTFGGWEWDKGYSLIESSDGAIIAAGEKNKDAYVVKVSQNGILLWEEDFTGISEGYQIVETSDNNYVIIGSVYNISTGQDIYLFKINRFGKTIWEKEFDFIEGRDEFGHSVCPLDNGDIIITGWAETNNGDRDVIVMKLNRNGDIIWKKMFGGNRNDAGYKIIKVMDGNIVIVGMTSSFGIKGKNRISYRIGRSWDEKDFLIWDDYGSNVYALKLDFSGNKIWENNFGKEINEVAVSAVENEDGSITILGNAPTDDFFESRGWYSFFFTIKITKDGILYN